MEWTDLKNPGVFGFNKNTIFKKYDNIYGKDNWKIIHKYNGQSLDFLSTCRLFEEAYLIDSSNRKKLWNDLRLAASNVYDIDTSDINSELDYTLQNNKGVHIQDIAIRNIFQKKDWIFEGSELIQIRSGTGKFGNKLTPGRVPFHKPEHILDPRITKWWDYNSVEDFYQSNKMLQIRK